MISFPVWICDASPSDKDTRFKDEFEPINRKTQEGGSTEMKCVIKAGICGRGRVSRRSATRVGSRTVRTGLWPEFEIEDIADSKFKLFKRDLSRG